jgi:predicted nucleic acid-binding Zn ribbon protein
MGKRYYAGRIFPDDAERMPVHTLEDCECCGATLNKQVDGHGLVFQ